MVNAALHNGVLLHAKHVSRHAASTLKSFGEVFQCMNCNRKLTHVNESTNHRESHFRHPAGSEDCELSRSDACVEDHMTYDPEELNTEFLRRWQQSHPVFPCTSNCKIYNFGSPSGLVTIYDAVNKYQITRFGKVPLVDLPPHVFVLNGIKRNVSLYLTEDTREFFLKFGIKSEIEYILRIAGIALVVMGGFVFEIRDLSSLSEDYCSLGGEAEGPCHLYRCFCWEPGEVARKYFPEGYTVTSGTTASEPEIVVLKNLRIQREAERVKREELECAERMEREARARKREEEREAGARKREEELERFREHQARLQVPYRKRDLSTREDVRKLYEWYLTMYTPQTYIQNLAFVRQTTADGTEFIDISDQLIPMDLKCVYRTEVVLSEIQTSLLTI
jgi:hypothetical protein